MVRTRKSSPPSTADWQSALTPAIGTIEPGLVVAVARGEGAPEYLFHGVDGAANALAADTLFPVASIRKLATALAALRLVAEGRLSLDDPVAQHLPESPLARQAVAVRDLFCHTAGLPGD